VVKDFGSIISYSDSSWSVVVAPEMDSGHFEFVDEADRPAFIGRQLFNHGWQVWHGWANSMRGC